MIANILFFKLTEGLKLRESPEKGRQTDGKWEEKKYENEKINPRSPASYY